MGVQGQGRHLHVKLLVGMKKKGGEWSISFEGQWLAKSGMAFKKLVEEPDKYDGRIGECRWQPGAKTFKPETDWKYTIDGSWEDGGWVLQKLREDKTIPNDVRTAKRVVESIDEDLSLEDLRNMILEAQKNGSLAQSVGSASGYPGKREVGPTF